MGPPGGTTLNDARYHNGWKAHKGKDETIRNKPPILYTGKYNALISHPVPGHRPWVWLGGSGYRRSPLDRAVWPGGTRGSLNWELRTHLKCQTRLIIGYGGGINDVGLPNWWLLVIWYSSAVTFWYLMTCTLLNYWDSIIRILITISVKSSKGHQNSVYFIIVDGQNEMRAEARYYVDILTFSQFLIITFCRYILFQFPEEGRMVRIKVAFYWQRCLWPCHPISTTEFVRTRRLFILSIKILQPTALWRRDQVQPNCYL